MKRTIILLTMIGVLAGLLALPATSMHWTPGQGSPVGTQAHGNSNDHPVFAEGWSPLPNTWPFTGSTMPGNSDQASDDSGGDDAADVGVCVIGVDSPCNAPRWDAPDQDSSQDGSDSSGDSTGDGTGSTVTEERHVTPAPEPTERGDDYISYPNPRDHMPNPATAESDPSIKVCAVMLNQANEVIRGTTVSDATVSVPTDIPRYVEDTQPITFDLPIDQRQDLIGTSSDLPEGDGMLDAECGEYHNLPEQSYSYGEPAITGADADQIEFVGVTEYWDGTGEGDPFNQQVYDFGENELSDGHIPTLVAGDYDRKHAEVVYLFRLK